ncbi:type II toxin-antitoxin system HicB family antitoxin [Butyrivibrio sp. XPD2002]|uniref:type II toxin-antitoxin system HicB family antitoxin n=1 Tax=Butyrivibrio sp. XPD2002 TaxID=1280665 RepID=UPI0003FCC23D|nr:type II toxin-antitoxin system HicB family antitoxin [Butyrivibrio sp. XPD2002]
MKVTYPVFIKQSGKDFLVYIPDLDGYTEGKDLADAIEMARDYIGLVGIDQNKNMPKASSYKEALKKAKANKDIFDYSDGLQTIVDVDLTEYKRQYDNRAVRKNCTVPYWMTVKADEAGLNYSRVLQDAIAKMLNLNYNSNN